MLLALISQELGRSECESGRDDPLDCWVVGKVQEQASSLHWAVLFKILRHDEIKTSTLNFILRIEFENIFLHPVGTASCLGCALILACLKKRAVSMFAPIAANTMPKLSSWSSSTDFPGSLTSEPCRQICWEDPLDKLRTKCKSWLRIKPVQRFRCEGDRSRRKWGSFALEQ